MASLALRDGDAGKCERLTEEAIEALMGFTHTIPTNNPAVENLGAIRAPVGMGGSLDVDKMAGI